MTYQDEILTPLVNEEEPETPEEEEKETEEEI